MWGLKTRCSDSKIGTGRVIRRRYMCRTSSATQDFQRVTFVMLSLHFLFTTKPTLVCLSVVCLRVVQQVATLESGENLLFSSDSSKPYHVSPHVVFLQFFFQLLHVFVCSVSSVPTLCVAIFSRLPHEWGGGGSSL